MQSLREIQSLYHGIFLGSGSEHSRSGLRQDIRPAAIQIAVYQNNARETYRQALTASYPVIARLVGDDCFSGLVEKYRREYPSVSGDLIGFGSHFPEFLSGLYGDTDYAYLPDVAGLEWACEVALLGPECRGLKPGIEKNLNVDSCLNIRFKVPEEAHFVYSRYPVLDIWRVHQSTVNETVDLTSGPDHIVVARRLNDAVLKRISPGAFDLALAFRRRVTVAEAFEIWSVRYDINDFGRALEVLITSGLLCDFSLD